MPAYLLNPVDILPERECAANVLAGQPIYIDNSGFIRPAQANQWLSSQIAGLAIADTTAGSSVQFRHQGQITLADWTNVAGSVLLTPGRMYQLSQNTPGAISFSFSPSPGSFSVPVGRATNANTLSIRFSRLIKIN